jgi:acetyltransferase-like isoleucine patch superfamily enzyme
MKRKLYIFGTKNFGELSHFYFSTDSHYEVAGFTVDAAYRTDTTFLGLPVVPYEELRKSASREDTDIFIAIGIAEINELRAKKFFEVQRDGFRLASFLSSKAHVRDDFVLRPNTMIMDHVATHPHIQVGCNSIIWSNTRMAWRSAVGDHAWVTSAVLGETSYVGDYTFVGISATIGPFVRVGTRNLIGAGAMILKDTADNAIYRSPRSVASRATTLRARTLIK